MSTDLRLGDCRVVMASLADASVDAIVTDPPYGLRFMGKRWDYDVPGVPVFTEMLRVLVDGGRLLCFAGARTAHRMTCNIEDAGFAIEDVVMWLYGSGFPKHRSKLKPAYEPIVWARKGAVTDLNVDAGRIEPGPDDYDHPGDARAVNRHDGRKSWRFDRRQEPPHPSGRWPANVALSHHENCRQVGTRKVRSGNHVGRNSAGREKMPGAYSGGLPDPGRDQGYADADGLETIPAWDCHPECAVRLLDEQSGDVPGMPLQRGGRKGTSPKGYGMGVAPDPDTPGFGDFGGASRFFYCSKASRAERDAGLQGLEAVQAGGHLGQQGDKRMGRSVTEGANVRTRPRVLNPHPTVKPVDLMRWLVRLVARPGQTVLDPFMGSGTTGVACTLEGVGFVGIEREPDYLEIARLRIANTQPSLFAASGDSGEAA